MMRINPEEELKDAIEIIETLVSYGMIRPIQGVVYPLGSHEEVLQKAQKWLWINRRDGHIQQNSSTN